jgi:hypothetical protein
MAKGNKKNKNKGKQPDSGEVKQEETVQNEGEQEEKQ